MENKLPSPRPPDPRCVERDRRVCAGIISAAVMNETLSVMYNAARKTQLSASARRRVGALHLGLQAPGEPETATPRRRDRRRLNASVHGELGRWRSEHEAPRYREGSKTVL